MEKEIIEAIENDLKNIDLYGDTYDKKYAKLLDLYNKQKELLKKYENYCRLRSVVDFYKKNSENEFIPKSKIKELEELEEINKKEKEIIKAKDEYIAGLHQDLQEAIYEIDRLRGDIDE